jgi:hypothetical protein
MKKSFYLLSAALLATLMPVPMVAAAANTPTGMTAGSSKTEYPVQASEKILSRKFSGGCTQNRGYPGQVVMEEKYDPTCRLTVLLSGKTVRNISLQFWDENENRWLVDASRKSSKGKAVFSINARTCDDEYCNGTWEFRIVVAASAKPKFPTIKSPSFYIRFVALDSGAYDDEYECDPDYEDCF